MRSIVAFSAPLMLVCGSAASQVYPERTSFTGSIPARTVRELLAIAKASPGALNSASAGVGSSNDLALVLFNMMSAANIAHVPYKGAAPAIADVMGRHVAIVMKVNGTVVDGLKTSRVKEILAASGADAAGTGREALGALPRARS